MGVEEREVRAVAQLARLALDDAEVHALTGDLTGILGYVGRLVEVDGAPSVGGEGTAPLRADVPRATAAAEGLRAGGEPAAPTAATEPKPKVPISVFGQLELKTGRILEAAKHPKADRLLVLQVDVGEERPRAVVAGLAAFYPDSSVLVGRIVVAVTNLEPATLRGVTSEAMLLAAGGQQHVGLVTVAGDAVRPGEVVR